MEQLLDGLKKNFEETPREKILKDWEETKKCDNVGVTVKEFLQNNKDIDNKK
jgi:predicted Ser/Thr protein kinase